MIIKVDRIIIRNANLKVEDKDLEKLRKQIAALFQSDTCNILFTYEDTDEKKIKKRDKQLNLNEKGIF